LGRGKLPYPLPQRGGVRGEEEGEGEGRIIGGGVRE